MKNKYNILILLAFILWMSIGAFPFFCFEGDSNSVISGCNILINEGFHLPPIFSYRYDMQPGITLIIVGLKTILPFFSTSQLYAFITLLSGITFILLSIQFARKFVDVELWVFVLALFLLLESYAIITYPNSSIVAAALFMGALICMRENHYIWMVLLMVLAAVVRIDIIIVFPVILPLYLLKGETVKKALFKSISIAVLFLILTVPCYLLVRANPFNIAKIAEGYNESLSLWKTVLVAIFAYYSINVVTIPLGLTLLCRKKQFKLVLMVLTPILLIHFFYRMNATAAKHFLYTLPFDLIIVSYFWNYILKRMQTKYLKWSVICLLVVFSMFSIRFSQIQSNKEHLYLSESGRWDFYSKNVAGRKLSVGVGVGQIVNTADELMAISGNLFYPFYIHNIKSYLSQNLDEIISKIEGDSVKVINVCYEDHYTIANVLMEKGLTYEKLNDVGSLYNLKGETLYQFELYEVQEQDAMNKLIEDYPDKSQQTYIMTQYGHYMNRCDDLVGRGILTRVTEGLYRFKEHDFTE